MRRAVLWIAFEDKAGTARISNLQEHITVGCAKTKGMGIIMCKVKEWMGTLTETMELSKKEYLLTVTASLFGGVIIGFLFAPKRTRHTIIGSNNGPKNSSNEYGHDFYDSWDELEDMEQMEDCSGNLEIGDEELSFR